MTKLYWHWPSSQFSRSAAWPERWRTRERSEGVPLFSLESPSAGATVSFFRAHEHEQRSRFALAPRAEKLFELLCLLVQVDQIAGRDRLQIKAGRA